MSETREVKDPFTGKTEKINNCLVNRLRGKYAIGPTLTNGEPEFGWRQMGPAVLIQDEAAAEIERLRAALAEARDLLLEIKQGGHARSPNHNARLVIDAALKPQP